MLNPKVEKFLEEHNLTYLFLMLANLEVERLTALPDIIKSQFKGKLTEKALEHIALNVIPDYIGDLPASEKVEENPFE